MNSPPQHLTAHTDFVRSVINQKSSTLSDEEEDSRGQLGHRTVDNSNSSPVATSDRSSCLYSSTVSSAGQASEDHNPYGNLLAASGHTTAGGYGSCNPHGIDTILNRSNRGGGSSPSSPHSPSSPPQSSVLSDSSSRLSCFNALGTPQSAACGPQSAVAAAVQMQQQQQQQVAACKLEEMQQRQNLYWPGIQGLLTNPTFWRDRSHFTGRHQAELLTHIMCIMSFAVLCVVKCAYSM